MLYQPATERRHRNHEEPHSKTCAAYRSGARLGPAYQTDHRTSHAPRTVSRHRGLRPLCARRWVVGTAPYWRASPRMLVFASRDRSAGATGRTWSGGSPSARAGRAAAQDAWACSPGTLDRSSVHVGASRALGETRWSRVGQSARQEALPACARRPGYRIRTHGHRRRCRAR